MNTLTITSTLRKVREGDYLTPSGDSSDPSIEINIECVPVFDGEGDCVHIIFMPSSDKKTKICKLAIKHMPQPEWNFLLFFVFSDPVKDDEMSTCPPDSNEIVGTMDDGPSAESLSDTTIESFILHHMELTEGFQMFHAVERDDAVIIPFLKGSNPVDGSAFDVVLGENVNHRRLPRIGKTKMYRTLKMVCVRYVAQENRTQQPHLDYYRAIKKDIYVSDEYFVACMDAKKLEECSRTTSTKRKRIIEESSSKRQKEDEEEMKKLSKAVTNLLDKTLRDKMIKTIKSAFMEILKTRKTLDKTYFYTNKYHVNHIRTVRNFHEISTNEERRRLIVLNAVSKVVGSMATEFPLKEPEKILLEEIPKEPSVAESELKVLIVMNNILGCLTRRWNREFVEIVESKLITLSRTDKETILAPVINIFMNDGKNELSSSDEDEEQEKVTEREKRAKRRSRTVTDDNNDNTTEPISTPKKKKGRPKKAVPPVPPLSHLLSLNTRPTKPVRETPVPEQSVRETPIPEGPPSPQLSPFTQPAQVFSTPQVPELECEFNPQLGVSHLQQLNINNASIVKAMRMHKMLIVCFKEEIHLYNTSTSPFTLEFDFTAPEEVKSIALDPRDDSFYVLSGTTITKYSHDGTYILKLGRKLTLKNPSAVAVDMDGKIYISELEEGKAFITNDAKEDCGVITLGKPGIRPIDMCFDHEFKDIILVDQSKSALRIISKQDGKQIKKIGGRGTAKGQFMDPCGLHVDTNGIIYVCDKSKARIQALNPQGQFLAFVAQQIKLVCPRSITSAKNGLFLVADEIVQVLKNLPTTQ